MLEILLAVCGIKIFWWWQNLLILTDGMQDSFKIDGGMQDSYKIDGGIRDGNKITHHYRGYKENCDSKQVAGIEINIVNEAG